MTSNLSPEFGPAGAALHAAITAEYDTAPADEPILAALCREADALHYLAEKLAAEPTNLALLRAHHSCALTFAKLRASLGLHSEGADARPGVYEPRRS